MEKTIGCVVMAAGNAVRFGENKLAQTVGGKSLIQRVLDAIPTEVFSAVAVVTQYPEVEALAEKKGFLAVKNEHPDHGISHTIALGLSAVDNCDAVLFTVSDQPLLTAETFRRIVEAWKSSTDSIVAAAHDGKRGNPCLFPRRFYPELLLLREDHGGSAVIRRHEDILLLVETDPRELTDCDTKSQLMELISEECP